MKKNVAVLTTLTLLFVMAASSTALAQSRGGGGGAQAAPAASAAAAPSSSSGTTGLKGLRPSASPKVLTLEQAFAQAVQQSFDLRIAAARVDEAQSQVKKAWSAVMPQLSAGGDYSYNFPDQSFAFGSAKQNQQQALLFNSIADITAQSAALNPDPIKQRAALEQAEALRTTAKDIANAKVTQIELTPTNVVQGQIQLSVPLFNGRAIPLIQNAYAGIDISKLATKSARAAIIYGTARAYYQVVAAKRIVEIAQQQVASATAHRDLAKQRVDEGLSTPLALQRAELDLARSQQQMLGAAGALKLGKGALGSLVGTVEDFDVAEPPTVPALEVGKSPEDLYTRALAARDNLRLEKQSLGIADRNKTDAWMRFLPSLQLSASGRGTSNTGGLVSEPFTGVVAVQLDVPIFDGGLTLGTLDEADARLRQELLKVRQIEASIEQEVRGTVDDLEIKRTAVETADRVAELARAQKTNVDDLFAAGAATSLDVSDASLNSFSADVDAARARFDLETARLGLAYAIGELRPNEDLSPQPLSDEEAGKARGFIDAVKE